LADSNKQVLQLEGNQREANKFFLALSKKSKPPSDLITWGLDLSLGGL